jgi:hypothetical protein
MRPNLWIQLIGVLNEMLIDGGSKDWLTVVREARQHANSLAGSVSIRGVATRLADPDSRLAVLRRQGIILSKSMDVLDGMFAAIEGMVGVEKEMNRICGLIACLEDLIGVVDEEYFPLKAKAKKDYKP